MKKIVVLILAFVLFVVCVGCGGDASNVSKIPLDDYYEGESYKNNKNPFENSQSDNIASASDKNNNNSSKNNSSKNHNNSNITTSQINNNTSVNNNANTSSVTSTAPTNKKDINILLPRKLTKQEQSLVDNYKKTHEIKINITVTSTNDYYAEMVSLISSGKSPDLVVFDSNAFPIKPTAALQPINDYISKSFNNLNSKYMDAFKVGDKIFGFAKSGNWFNNGKDYVMYYNAKVFENTNITTPYELYKQGKWNWETQKETLMFLKNKGKPSALKFQRPDLMMLSAGEDFISYNGSTATYTNNINNITNDSLITKAWQEIASLYSNGDLNADESISDFVEGKNALFGGAVENMCRDFGFFDNFKDGAENICAVPIPGPKGKKAFIPTNASCFGVPKKSKNPDGAIAFLNYFLDNSNYSTNNDFYNNQLKEIFGKVANNNQNKIIAYFKGACETNSNLPMVEQNKLYKYLYSANYGSDPAVRLKNLVGSTVKAVTSSANNRVEIFLD